MDDNNSTPEKRGYQMTERERQAARRYLNRKNASPPAPKYKVQANGSKVDVKPDHADPVIHAALLADTLAVADLMVADVLLDQIANIARAGRELKESELNGMLAMIHGLAPRDTAESLLVVQMVAIHNAVAVAARRLAHVENIPQQDSASNMLNKLARTFTAQIEALKRYRSGGEQKVTVQHVQVNAGQAVVGFNQGGGGTHEKSGQSHALGASAKSGGADACGTALLVHEQAVSMSLQGAGCERSERVPDARGKGGCAPRETQRSLATR